MTEKTISRILGAFVFLFSLVVYYSTIAPTVSFWDCGEFIACSYKLAVPHPPGAPLYLLVARIFTLLPIFADIAKRVNFISNLSSAFTVLFLYLITASMIRAYLGKERKGFMAWVPYLGSAIGALSFAFTTSFWFNAVEAEVYAPSMLFTSLVVWLIMVWSERSDQIGNERYLLVIMYMVGLAIGVHLLNVLALPMVFMIIYYKKYQVNFQTFVYLVLVGGLLTGLIWPGMVQGIPYLARLGGFFGLLVVLVGLLLLLVYSINRRSNLASLLITSVLLITIGYSTYLMIYIRSGLDPNIDENDPETVEAFISYMNREQYGEHTLDRAKVLRESPNGKRYTSTFDFFWNYQINHMYFRYFFWNFLGKSDTGDGFSLFKFLAIPFLLGIYGAYYHFKRDWKYALAVFALFFMTGLAIVLYLNQPDPQPRERDYSYVGSFFAFAIWIGIGVAALLEWLTKQSENSALGKFFPATMAFFIFLLSPVQMMLKNYHTHNRSGNYVAWDYSYNMLQSCEPNGIVYTNGDNDTFPLWYLQEVEGIRTDVRVANLSLLNTSWYIKQLKHMEPKVPITLSDLEIEQIMPIQWPKERTIEIDIPQGYYDREKAQYRQSFKFPVRGDAEKMAFKVRPKLFNRYLRVQDYMILNTLVANRFQKPLYFAVTCSRDNMLDELQKYLRMDGLTFKITTIPNWTMEPNILYDNLMNKYQYRNLNNPDVYYNENIIALLQNYRSAFIQLANYYVTQQDTQKVVELVKKMNEVMPETVIPYTNPTIRNWADAFAYYAGVKSDSLLNLNKYTARDLESISDLLLKFGKPEAALKGFEELIAANPNNNRAMGYLVEIYGQLKQYQKGIELLEKWLEQNPSDRGAKMRLEEYKGLLKSAKAKN